MMDSGLAKVSFVYFRIQIETIKTLPLRLHLY